MSVGLIIFLVLGGVGVVFLVSLRGLIYVFDPSEVGIFSGSKRRDGARLYGYRLIKGGRGIRMPLLERVDKMDLTTMVIDIQAANAYSKGGIPLTVQGVANVKIAGHEPLIYNAIERFLGKSRQEIMQIAKATLEGSLRGILATMTPEQVNEDKLMFAEKLVAEVEQDMTSLGLVVDTMKIQNVQDEVKYLDSLGRKRNAEVISKARTAEAIAHADSEIQTAENLERQKRAQIGADTDIAKAEAQRRLTETLTRRTALVAEEQSQVVAAVAQARAELEVQKARIEQVRMKMEADIVAPAIANAEAAEANAKASTAYIIEEGKARADALRLLAETYRQAGPSTRQVLLTQKLNGIITALTDTIPMTNVDKVTMIDSRTGGGTAGKAISMIEQVKQLFGVDIVEKINAIGNGSQQKALEPAAVAPAPFAVPQHPKADPVPLQQEAKQTTPMKSTLAQPPPVMKPKPPKLKED